MKIKEKSAEILTVDYKILTKISPDIESFAGFPYIEPTVGRPWPLPQSETPGDGYMTVDPTDFTFQATGESCDILTKAFQRYQSIIFSHENPTMHKPRNQKERVSENLIGEGQLTSLNVNLASPCEDYPYLNMDEQYELKICAPDSPTEATLDSNSIWGILRGLETFSQILVKNGSLYSVSCTQILDFPRYAHRGVHLDTSRHFLPLEKILENLDLMAMNKFNIFHWHIVDDQSFPYVSSVYPDLSAKGAWSDIHVYTLQDINIVVNYARDLGIRVIPEFDTPETEPQSELTVRLIQAMKKISVFLQNLFQEIASRFPDHYLHLGGDEVPFTCWSRKLNSVSFSFKKNYKLFEIVYNRATIENKRQFYEIKLWQKKFILSWRTYNMFLTYIVWEEVFNNGVQIAPDTVVHVWKHSSTPIWFYSEIASVTAAGYQALLSSCWYLNLIEYGTDWQKFYDCDPQGFDGTDEQKSLVLGGEACMWAEYIDETNVISTMWPRAAPVAERLWSNKNDTTSADEASPRLEEHRCRLFRRGYAVEPLGPSYCPEVL
ncbi:Beta-hexosaminidase subunit beta [Armadillidium nasatum]|uniref:Beta-hexosaminidase n=1 Tax=Armadillidium nasatum TaxID=96803 RepID=A0A5N5TGL7_9CRUS|nr:Beta-hexosaminidase subunit beta [Armadillidium nasatum]